MNIKKKELNKEYNNRPMYRWNLVMIDGIANEQQRKGYQANCLRTTGSPHYKKKNDISILYHKYGMD